MSKRYDSIKLKYFIDAIKGRRLSWSVAAEINDALGIVYGSYNGDDKLRTDHRTALQTIADEMIARGVKPAKSLLTPHQRKSLARRRA